MDVGVCDAARGMMWDPPGASSSSGVLGIVPRHCAEAVKPRLTGGESIGTRPSAEAMVSAAALVAP